MAQQVETVHPKSRSAWRAWLAANHATASGVWLVREKKRGGAQRLTLDDAVEEALCFGWIDSKLRRLDDHRSVLLFTPRKPGGTWSRTNKRRVDSLVTRGLMEEAGRRAVARAKRDGSWTLLDDIEDLRAPDDLDEALAASTSARRNFDGFAPSKKKEMLWWIKSAKRPETRARRIAEVVALAAQNQTPARRPKT